MYIKKIKELIENSDMSKPQKNIATGFIDRSEKLKVIKSEDIELIEQVARQKRVSEILFSNDKVKIYSIYGKDEWDVSYPIRSIFVNKKGVWERSSTVSPNFDIAFLVYLEKRYLGENVQFVDFALKILEIKIEE